MTDFAEAFLEYQEIIADERAAKAEDARRNRIAQEKARAVAQAKDEVASMVGSKYASYAYEKAYDEVFRQYSQEVAKIVDDAIKTTFRQAKDRGWNPARYDDAHTIDRGARVVTVEVPKMCYRFHLRDGL